MRRFADGAPAEIPSRTPVEVSTEIVTAIPPRRRHGAIRRTGADFGEAMNMLGAIEAGDTKFISGVGGSGGSIERASDDPAPRHCDDNG
jgi:hypothetical protein